MNWMDLQVEIQAKWSGASAIAAVHVESISPFRQLCEKIVSLDWLDSLQYLNEKSFFSRKPSKHFYEKMNDKNLLPMSIKYQCSVLIYRTEGVTFQFSNATIKTRFYFHFIKCSLKHE